MSRATQWRRIPERHQCRKRPSHPLGAGQVLKLFKGHPLSFDVFRREYQVASYRSAVEYDSDSLLPCGSSIEVESVEEPEHRYIESGLLFCLPQNCRNGCFALSHAAAAGLPLARRVILGHASLEKQHVAIALDQESNDDEESSVHVRRHVPVRFLDRPITICSVRSLDYLIRPLQERRWNREAEGLGRLEVDDELEFLGLLDREVARLGALEDFVDIRGGAPVHVR